MVAKAPMVEGAHVDHGLLLQLLGDALDPPPLLQRPLARREHPLLRGLHPQLVGHQRAPERPLADEPDDPRGDVGVGLYLPRRPHLGLAVPAGVERRAHLLQHRPGEVARALQHHLERRDQVDLLPHERVEAVEVVTRLHTPGGAAPP